MAGNDEQNRIMIFAISMNNFWPIFHSTLLFELPVSVKVEPKIVRLTHGKLHECVIEIFVLDKIRNKRT